MVKQTITQGNGFHIYKEDLNPNFIYLELKDKSVQFYEATPNQLTIRIPAEIWEYLRKFPALDLSLTRKSEKEILKEIKKTVQERSKSQTQIGFFIYGHYTDPQPTQIQNALTYFKELKKQQTELLKKLNSINQ